jgi:hypothetical protein
LQAGLVTERLRVGEIGDDEGRRLVRIVRRGTGPPKFTLGQRREARKIAKSRPAAVLTSVTATSLTSAPPRTAHTTPRGIYLAGGVGIQVGGYLRAKRPAGRPSGQRRPEAAAPRAGTGRDHDGPVDDNELADHGRQVGADSRPAT